MTRAGRQAGRRLRVGLTGGIASGKTTVADLFADLGIPVIDTDQIARDVAERGRPAFEELIAEFGSEVLAPDGTLDRRRLRAMVFADETRRQRLEAILHPRIRQETLARADAAEGPYQVLVVPLLVETGFSAVVDRVLVVDCPEAVQRERLLERDAETSDQVDRMIAAQVDRATRLAAADDVIDNAGSLNATRRQVATLHRKYLALATSDEN